MTRAAARRAGKPGRQRGKFTEAGSVALTVTPTRAAKDKVGVCFSVSDSGIGLSLVEIKRLFRPFSQANVSIAQRFGGAGLGLSSVKQLARAMGGDIAVRQRRGGGAGFCADGDPGPRRRAGDHHRRRRRSIAGSNAGLRILSVEDNPFGRVVLNAILTELGHSAEFIGRGEAATARIAKAPLTRC